MSVWVWGGGEHRVGTAAVRACYAAGVKGKPTIAIIGAGRLGTALGVELKEAGYKVQEILAGPSSSSQRKAETLARRIGARVLGGQGAQLKSDLLWLCVPDRQISPMARDLAQRQGWEGKIAFHSSGALPSDELESLKLAGASVAAVHPFMTFVAGEAPELDGVPFGIEGDQEALAAAGRIVRSLGGATFPVKKQNKAAYHAWGGFASPLLVALLMTGEQVASTAGISAIEARKKMMPIIRQTVDNYEKLGPEGAFTGPLVRGDAEVVRRHLALLRKAPAAREVYLALARSALKRLKVRNRGELEQALQS